MTKKAESDNEFYREYNDDYLMQVIQDNADEMLKTTGDIDYLKILKRENIDNSSLYNYVNKTTDAVLYDGKKNKRVQKDLDRYIKYLDEIDYDKLKKLNDTEFNEFKKDFNAKHLLYVINIKSNFIDLIGNKEQYVRKLARNFIDLQISEIHRVGYDTFVNTDIDKLDIKIYVRPELLKQIQRVFKDEPDYLKLPDYEINAIIKDLMDKGLIKNLTKLVNKIIKDNQTYYNAVHLEYTQIETIIQCTKDIISARELDLEKPRKVNAPKPKTPEGKEMSLYATKIFNNTYLQEKDTKIVLHDNKYTLKLRLIVDEVNDLRDIVLYDDINNKSVTLYPIDLALFIGFTNFNAINGNNIPTTINDVVRFMSENNKSRLKKGSRALKVYEDRLLLYDRTKVNAEIIKKMDNGEDYVLFETKDPISILKNDRVYINNRGELGYIIGASAILTIVNELSKDSGIDFLASYKNVNNYINDGQSNTIDILNMKYYILPKILQMRNAKNNGKGYNGDINLNPLYKQLADLKGKTELSRTETGRVRNQIDKFMTHLANKQLLDKDKTYYKSGNKLLKDKKDMLGLTKPIDHLNVKL